MTARITHGARPGIGCHAAALCLLALAGTATAAAEPASEPRAAGPQEIARELLGSEGVRPGLCLHLGCSDGALTAELALAGRFVVHGLTSRPEDVEKARAHVRSRGPYGPVAVDYSPLASLLYADDTANVIVASDFDMLAGGGLTRQEILRVLAPGGAAFLERNGGWERASKPRPAAMDGWGQYRHDASRGAVSRDVLVGPPTSVRWIAGGRWVALSAGMGGIYSAGGRVFEVYPTGQETTQTLVARDAYNGLKLWEQQVEISTRSVKDLIVAVGDHVYTVVEKDGPVVAIDATTGEVARTYAFKAGALTYHEGMLIRAPGKPSAWDAETGEMLWEASVGAYPPHVVGDGRLFLECYGQDELACLDVETGRELWRVPNQDQASPLCYRGGMLFTKKTWLLGQPGRHEAPGALNHAYSAEDGRLLWTRRYKVHWHQGLADVFFLGGAVWVQDDGPPQAWVGLDPATGEVKRSVGVEATRSFLRCYPDRATEKYILQDVGMGFFDFREGSFLSFYGGRGTCGAGWIPANGLVYRTPDICVCFAELRGAAALAPGPMPDPRRMMEHAGPALRKGPAFGAPGAETAPGDWPTYRHDPARTGGTPVKVGLPLRKAWEAEVAAVTTPPVAAGGRVYLTAPDEHRVVALDARSGKPLWSATAGGRIDSPPTVSGGRVLFGSADGWVYCLAAGDGALAWRRRAAPEDRRIVVRGQVESLWPVHGSVLVRDGTAWFAAGRHSELDGGIMVYAADSASGELLWQRQVIREDLLAQRQVNLVVNTTNGILAADGGSLFMDRAELDPATGRDAPGKGGLRMYGGACAFVEDIARPPHSWKHEWRNWSYTSFPVSGKALPNGDVAAGTALAAEGDLVVGLRNETLTIFARRVLGPNRAENAWSVQVPEGSRPKAILLAGGVVFVAAMPDADDPARGVIWAYNAESGAGLGECALDAAPLFDGMAAVPGWLYVSTQDGRAICLSGG